MNKLPERKFRAVLSLFATASLFAVNGFAQTTASSDNTPPANSQTPQVLEKYVVTGSNIPTAADALAIPVTVLGHQQIENTGVKTNILDLLRKAMPQFSGNSNLGTENANIASNTTYGGSQIAIHNLSTLVLINGRRVAFDPAEGVGGYEFVDLNMIPIAAVQDIQVLTDGASAIYGSDAVGGVVNIILKKDYNGWEVGGHYGQSTNQGHYRERSGYISGGVSTGRTSVSISAEYTQDDPILQYERPFSNPIYGTTYYPGVIDVFNLSDYSDQRYMLNPKLNAPPGGNQYTIDQLVANGTYTPITASQALHGFNLANYTTLRTNLRRRSAVINVTHDIFGENLSAFGDGMFTNTFTQSQLNAQPLYPNLSDAYLDPFWLGGYPPPPGNMYLPADTPTSPFSQAWMDQGSPADYSKGYVVTAHNRFFTYPRIFQNDSTLFRGVGGLRGKFGDGYTWEVAANLNRYELNYTNPNLVNTVAFDDALASGRLNPFAYTQPAGVLPGNILGTAFFNAVSTLNSFDAKVTGTPFTLPGGQLGFAIGASYTREALAAQPDVNSIPDENGNIGWAGATSLQPFNSHRKITAFYGEVTAPIVSPTMGVPAVHSLNIDLAGRYEEYTQIGSSEVPKVSLRYQPIDDQLTFRGTAGKSFSVPTLYNLYGPISTGFTNSISFNNYGGGTTDQIQFESVSGSNPHLKPSTATTWTAGVVYTPKFAPGLSISIDYRQTVQKNLAGFYDQTVIAQSVELLGPQSPYAGTVHFGNPNGSGVTAPGQLSKANPSSVYLVTPLVNLAAQAVKGTDITVEYGFDTPSIGRFDIASTANIYHSYIAQALPTENYFSYVGHASGNGSVSQGTIPRVRTYTTVNWRYHAYNAFVGHTYVSSVTDIGPGGSAAITPVPVASYQSYDLGLGYDFSKLNANRWLSGLSVNIGANNVFNKMPPLAPAAFPDSNVDQSTYNEIGRFYYVDASYKF
ncbi:MAG TPA: TonB-dependent receptor [Opitutaceae bacterium]|nr:TonB-dependent receptor [Opitutaceae bacterium]